MKKILSTLAFGAVMATGANADVIRVEAGAGVWAQSPSGTITYDDGSVTGTYTSKEDEYSGVYAWMLIKHPLPVIPNLRLEYTDIKDEGMVDGSFEDFTSTNSPARIKLKEYDILPYYNILDNTFWATLDLGLNVRIIDSTIEVDTTSTGNSYKDSSTVVIPMLYARVRTEIPMTNFGLETDVKYISYDGSTVYDVRAKVDYTFDITPLIQPALEVGYRVQKFNTISDDDKTKMDMDFSGMYAGLMFRF